MPEETLDVAVVGAGVSGAYSAWRLADAGHKVGLFEYSDRVGGRLFSYTFDELPNVHAELGGMRFIPDQHKVVTGLVAELHLATSPFPMGAPPPVAGENNIMHLRGRLFRARDFADPDKVPYAVNTVERGLNPDQLQAYVMKSLFPNADAMTQDDWFNATAFGKPLYETGFWNLLYRVLSSEAFFLMSDGGGYYTNVANTNAVSSLPTNEFAPTIVYETLEQGYEQLPIALGERFEAAAPGALRRNHRLASIARDGSDGPYRLVFVRTQSSPDGRTEDVVPCETVEVTAKRVVLAMPRRSLELVDWAPLRAPGDARSDLRSVIVQAAFKLFLVYPYPWWRALGVQAGRSITDMPIRQTFYFGTEAEQPGGDDENLASLMMASYNDLGSLAFWKALEAGEKFGAAERRLLAGAEGEDVVADAHWLPTQQMVEQAQEQIRTLHGVEYVPEPIAARYQDWTRDPYGGGWHGWKAGYRYWEVMERMRKPVRGEEVYVCGEAYSNNQGWVEGALQVAERMLEDHFALPRPDWIPHGYDLGP
jgi:monoamine oxidase